MLGYSRKRYEVFIFREKPTQRVNPKIEVDTRLYRLSEITNRQWKQLRDLQGQLVVIYLRSRYGTPETYLLLTFIEEKLAHIEWIVPAYKLKYRYPFVSNNSYSIISCLTARDFRGLGIYPSQIQRVVNSNISANKYWIWTELDNLPSLRGINKAGGIKVGEFVQTKWIWGLFSKVRYFPEGSDDK
jgi:hypothetical protein